jgi:hypothetical protein
MTTRRLRYATHLIVFLAVYGSAVCAQSISPSRTWSLALEVGNWQPQSLNEQPVFSTFGKAGATPLFMGAVSLPLVADVGIRFAGGFWSLRNLEGAEQIHSLTLHSLNLDLKYWLVPDFRLSAYVLYGASGYWGVENEKQPFGQRIRKAKPGWGANLGAGFDIALSRRFGIGVEFEYRFIRFKEPMGGIEDFSGPKIGCTVYLFP